MADLSATAAAITATGLTFYGVATGLDPSVLIAGFAGGAWAQTYTVPTSLAGRVSLSILASVIAGYLTPVAAAAVALAFAAAIKTAGIDVPREAFTSIALKLPLALLIGLTAHRALGPAFMRLAVKKVEELGK